MGGLFGCLPPCGVSELLPRGLVRPEFPGISRCWTVTQDAFVQLWRPCPFKTFKKHLLFFVTGASALVPTQRSCCPVSLVSRTPRMHCVCALVQMARSGCLAVLGSFSLPAPTPLLPPGAGVRGLRAALLPRGLGHPNFPGIPSCWPKCPGMLPSSCGVPVLLRFFKGHSLFFVPGVPAVGTCSQVLLSCSSSILHTTHCVSVLWCGWLGLAI